VERRGVPTVLFVTDAFDGLARAAASSRGMPDLRRVVIPHPLGGLAHDEVMTRAAGAVDEVVRLLGSA
jgi:hypothetical protein